MIKRGVLGALLIFDKVFFLSTHIARIWMQALTGRLMFHSLVGFLVISIVHFLKWKKYFY